MKKLVVLCPQEYTSFAEMSAHPCTRCGGGWNGKKCTIPTGAEHLPNEANIPDCPIQDRCQHQIQSKRPCIVRRKGLVCESAFIVAGMSREEASRNGSALDRSDRPAFRGGRRASRAPASSDIGTKSATAAK